MQISAGRSVDTNGARSLEKDPRRDRPRELIPLSLLQRCLIPAAIFPIGRAVRRRRERLPPPARPGTWLSPSIYLCLESFGWTEEFGSSVMLFVRLCCSYGSNR